MKEGEEIVIESLSSHGEGVGRIDGLTLFVEGGLPNEHLLIKREVQKKSYAKAKILTILEPSSDRTLPPCPYFGLCGGCQIMHLHYQAQLSFKTQKVKDALERIGKLDGSLVRPCIASLQELHYRNKIQLPLVWDIKGKTMGLYRKESHQIIPIESCLIQSHLGEKIMHYVQKELLIDSVRHLLIKTNRNQDQALVTFVTNGNKSEELKVFAKKMIEAIPAIQGVIENINKGKRNVILGEKERVLTGQDYLIETLLNKHFRISSKSFFQVNPLQAETLYEFVLSQSEIAADHHVVDAFCGVGTFSLFASDQAKNVIGIENVPAAVENAKQNAKLNGARNCEFFCASAERLFELAPRVDLIYLNPPRKGCERKLIENILHKGPKTIFYISCDPATLARDLLLFKTRYQIEFVQPFDMFPQTSHVESVVKLSRNCSPRI